LDSDSYCCCPWHFLYFFPEPHGHGSLRPTGAKFPPCWPSRPTPVAETGGATGGGGAGPLDARAPAAKRSAVVRRGGAGGGGGGIRRGGGGASTFTCTLRYRSVNVDRRSDIRSWNISNASFLYSTSGSFCP